MERRLLHSVSGPQVPATATHAPAVRLSALWALGQAQAHPSAREATVFFGENYLFPTVFFGENYLFPPCT